MAPPSTASTPLDGDTGELLKSARELLCATEHPNRAEVLAPKSFALYRREYDHLLHAADHLNMSMVEALTRGGSFSLFLLRRNAVRHFERLRLQSALEQIDAWQSAGGLPPQRDDLLRGVAQSVQWLLACKHQIISDHHPRPGPSRRLRHLPADWQETLLARAAPALRPALRIMTLTGCRPEELRRGVRVRIPLADPQTLLELVIQNAKNGSPDRPATRTYRFSRGSEHVDALIAELGHLPAWPKSDLFDPNDVAYYAAGVSQRIEDLVMQIWPARKHRPHAYSYRYAFRLKLKSLGFLDTEIAEALGHSSTSTQTVYGRGYAHGPAPDRGFTFTTSIPVQADPRRVRNRERFLERIRDRERGLEMEPDRQGPEPER